MSLCFREWQLARNTFQACLEILAWQFIYAENTLKYFKIWLTEDHPNKERNITR